MIDSTLDVAGVFDFCSDLPRLIVGDGGCTLRRKLLFLVGKGTVTCGDEFIFVEEYIILCVWGEAVMRCSCLSDLLVEAGELDADNRSVSTRGLLTVLCSVGNAWLNVVLLVFSMTEFPERLVDGLDDMLPFAVKVEVLDVLLFALDGLIEAIDPI